MKVVIAHDGSERGDDAVALGREITGILGATPLVITVLRGPADLAAEPESDRAAEAAAAEVLNAASAQLDGLSPETCWRVSRSPAEAIYELAENERAVAIVVGASHRSPVGRAIPGSVGSALLSGAPCSVAVAPRGFADDDDRSLRRIAVAFDGSPEAWAALETAIGIAERVGGGLSVLTVAEAPHYGYATTLSIFTDQDIESSEEKEKRRLLELAKRRIPEGLPCEMRLLRGAAGPVLAEAADGFDLMVLGSRGYGPLRRIILGSTAARFVGSAPCPVLVLPRAIGMDPLALRAPNRPGAVASKA